jgi:hypothetical protein
MFEIIDIEELLKRLDNYNHKELHVHHTYKPNHSSFNGSNGISLQEAMRDFHVKVNGWSDIGQHVTLLPNGLFVTGRDFGKTPASISGYNTGAFACETMGNFDVGNDILQGEQKNSLLKLAKYFNDKSKYIRFHRENAPKTCPGISIDKEAFMNEVKSFGVVSQSVEAPMVNPLGNLKVKEIQGLCNVLRVASLKVDGIAGPLTSAAVVKLPVIKYGSNIDQAIRVIQLITGVVADGVFGSKTLAAVKAFQSKYGLVADGIVGPKTWSKLLEVVK